MRESCRPHDNKEADSMQSLLFYRGFRRSRSPFLSVRTFFILEQTFGTACREASYFSFRGRFPYPDGMREKEGFSSEERRFPEMKKLSGLE